MKRTLMTIVALAAASVFLASPALSAEEVEHGYVGAASCKMCHKKAEKGEQFAKWLAGPHAGAWKTLGTPEAAAAAEKAGVAGNPQEAAECLSCHVTGHGAKAELLGKKYSVEEGVSCESCHGAGADYKKKSVMKDHEASVAAGLVVPDEKLCVGCHNDKSPTFKGFDYKEYLAKIAHPDPTLTK